MTAAPDPQIGPIVTEWRMLNSKITEKNKECEAIREKVQKLKNEHGCVASTWEEQRLTTEHTIEAVMEQVGSKQQELAMMEKETLALSAKIQERQKKIDDDTRIIQARDEAVDRNFKAMMEKESHLKIRIQEFREARDVAQSKLKKTIEGLEAGIPREQEEHARRLAAITAKTEEIEKQILHEEHQWELECATREYESLTVAQRAIESELHSAAEAKNQWSETLHTLSHQSNRYAALSNELAQLRQLIQQQ